MKNSLEKIQIRGLHGSRKNIEVIFIDNTLILVGENGSGKTTFLRILFYILAGKWYSLSQIDFESIEIIINSNTFTILGKTIKDFYNKLLSKIPFNVQDKRRTAEILEILDSGESFSQLGIDPRSKIARSASLVRWFDFAMSGEEDLFSSKESVFKDFRDVSGQIDAQILYLPTYRRIEKELSNIVDSIEDSEIRERKIMTELRM